jgi:GNAT superfamily N-acetyltransferase
MPTPTQPPAPPQQPPPRAGKDYKIRPLKRGDRDAAFKLLAADGWLVSPGDQELAISWVVQHPEMESFVAHDTAAFSRLFGMITMSHRPQLRLGGRVACIDLFLVPPEQRGKGIGHDLLAQALRRSQALGCKRVEIQLPRVLDQRHEFFEKTGFVRSDNELYVRPTTPLPK